MFNINNADTVTIYYKKGKPMHYSKEVILPPHSDILLRGKGEGGSILVKKADLKYKHDEKNYNQ